MTTIPPYLSRAYVSARPRTLFICATDRTYSYHASENPDLEGLPNVFWLPIKLKPCMDESAFFSDRIPEMFKWQVEYALLDFTKNYEGKFLSVIPDPKFGQSNWAGPMAEKTPQCYALLKEFFAKVQTLHEIDWRLRV